METNREPLTVEIPRELAEQVEHLVERIAASGLGRYAPVDREVALRIALARGIEALGEDQRTALE